MLCWVRSILPWSLVLSLKAVFTAMATRRKVLHIQQLPDEVRTQPEHRGQHRQQLSCQECQAAPHSVLNSTYKSKIKAHKFVYKCFRKLLACRSPETLPWGWHWPKQVSVGWCDRTTSQGLAGERCFAQEQCTCWFKEHSVPGLCKADTPQTRKWNQKINNYSSTYWDMHSFFLT